MSTPIARLTEPAESPPFFDEHFAIQSTAPPPNHVAIVMDGNRRWAQQRGLPASAGHRAGVTALRRLLPELRRTHVKVVTLFAFASANWARDTAEVSALMALAESALRRFTPLCLHHGIRIEVIGRRDRLARDLVCAIKEVEFQTQAGDIRVRIAVDYSSRGAITHAARTLAGASARVDETTLADTISDAPDVDLLIRTGKEQRLSDFLLWECAFAELWFPDLFWPEFDSRSLDAALGWYGARNRRFGR